MKRRPKIAKAAESRAEMEKNWEKAAGFYEGNASLPVLKSSKALSAIQKRQLLGPGKTKLVSLRVPEEDLEALRAIAEENDRGYQQLMIQAIEQFLDRYRAS